MGRNEMFPVAAESSPPAAANGRRITCSVLCALIALQKPRHATSISSLPRISVIKPRPINVSRVGEDTERFFHARLVDLLLRFSSYRIQRAPLLLPLSCFFSARALRLLLFFRWPFACELTSEMDGRELSVGGGGGGEKPQQRKQSETAAAAASTAALSCPRCESTDTKFCYYNNYSKLQPRHYCRACRRHWTDGGALRDVPVGGGRKSKRFKGNRGSKRTDVTLPEQEGNYSGSSALASMNAALERGRDPLFSPELDILGGVPFSPLLYDHTGQQDGFPDDNDGLFAMESTTRQLSPANNLSHWDDIIDLVNLELKPPGSERTDHTLTY